MKICVTWILFIVFATSDKSVTSLLCYSCSEMLSNENCLIVKECPSAEVCYGRADGYLSADVKHTTGCTKELNPVRTNVTGAYTFCSNACNESLCNLNACSKDSASKTRGPRCLSCDLVMSPDECTNIKECSTDQICFVTKIKAFQKDRYRLGCIGKQHCGQQGLSTVSLVGRRATTSNCSVCCSTDHCNLQACQKGGVDLRPLISLSRDVTCSDTNQAVCATFGLLSQEACVQNVVVATCPRSCATCDHVGWEAWHQWSTCSTTCGEGQRIRARDCIHRLQLTSKQSCIGNHTETSRCFTKYCPVNGHWSKWNTWGSCSSTCGGGSRHRERTCSNPTPKYNGASCQGSNIDSLACHLRNCPAVNGGWCYKHTCGPNPNGNYPALWCGDVKTSCSCPSPANGGYDCY